MLIRFSQRLRLEGKDYAAGEAVDLPSPVATALVERGVAVFAGGERLRRPERNRIRMPSQNRNRRAEELR